MAQVEWQTLKWVAWYNAERIHSAIEYKTPNETVDIFYADLNTNEEAARLLSLKISGKPAAVQKSTLCEDALKKAIRNRRPPPDLVHHSDRGVQHACDHYQKLLRLHGITASMSRKGNCLDNAPMESFFSSLKTEMVHRTRFQARRQARPTLFEYIEVFYNRKRGHSSIGYRTPAQARMNMTFKIAA